MLVQGNVVALGLLLCLLLACPEAQAHASSSAQSSGTGSTSLQNLKTTTVVGRVVNTQGTPLPGAGVTSNFGGQALSDGLGRYALEIVYPAQAQGVRLEATAPVQQGTAKGSQYQLGLVPAGRTQAGDLVVVTPCQPDWVSAFGGAPGLQAEKFDIVRALVYFDDGSGSGPALYVGGRFQVASGTQVNNIAKWDGVSWSALGSGMNDEVHALAVYDDGSGSGPALYAAGKFTSAGGVAASRVAKWDGQQWSNLKSGVPGFASDHLVSALCVFDDGSGSGQELYAGGKSSDAAMNVAKWNGQKWTKVGSQLLVSTVKSLIVHNDGSSAGPALYAGGVFGLSGTPVGVAVNVAKWNGQGWAPIGPAAGLNQIVNALAVWDDGSGSGPELYAAGKFTLVGNMPVNRIVKWDGQNWSPLGGGIGDVQTESVDCLLTYDDGSGAGPALYAGGLFNNAGSLAVKSLARWDGVSWSTAQSLTMLKGSTSDLTIYAMAIEGQGAGPTAKLCLGGNINVQDKPGVIGLVRWDGKQLYGTGSGLTGDVFALANFDDGSGPALYAGGTFKSAGGIIVNGLAQWNGQQWSSVGPSIAAKGAITCLHVHQDSGAPAPELYVGGHLSNDGLPGAQVILKWNGQNFRVVGSGLSSQDPGSVWAMATFNDGSGAGPRLYVAGSFDEFPSRMARWDGQNWANVSPAYNCYTNDLIVFDDGSGPALYASGLFLNLPGSFYIASNVVKLSGEHWVGLSGDLWQGLVLGAVVDELEVFDDGSGGGSRLYAAGSFNFAAEGLKSIARWDGQSWFPVGAGLGSGVRSLCVHDDGSGPGLYAAGAFKEAGGAICNRIAKWDGLNWSNLGEGLGIYENQGFGEGAEVLLSYDDGSGLGAALIAAGGFSSSPAGDSFIAKWGCEPALPSFALRGQGPGDGPGPVLSVRPFHDGARLVPRLDWRSSDGWRAGVLLVGAPGTGLTAEGWPVEGRATGSDSQRPWIVLPMPEEGGLLLPDSLLSRLRGQEVQVQALYLDEILRTPRFSNTLRLRIDR